jgi:putative colanic acid biosysnthesis UDP-glucose lipid carrier transferase
MSTAGLLRRYSRVIALSQRILDIVLILIMFMLAKLIWLQPVIDAQNLVLIFSAVSLFIFFANLSGLYRSWRGEGFWAEYRLVLLVFFSVILVLLVLGYVTKTTAYFSRLSLGTWILLVPLAFFLERIAVRLALNSLRRKGYNTRKVAIVGTGRIARSLAREIQGNDWMGLDIVGYYDNSYDLRYREDPADIPLAGNLLDLVNQAKACQLDEIFIGLPSTAHQQIAVLLGELSDSSVPVHLVPDLMTFNLVNARMINIGRVPLISVFRSPYDEVGAVLKRAEDVLLASIILCIIAAPMLLIALGIKLSSPGPVIFKQRRYGLKGEEILVWKFRSMSVMEDGSSIRQAGKKDARITPFGAFLRRTSLDELPQFINVLQGSMSIVGPRPHAVAHNEQYRKRIDGYMLRHLVKPGITGWAQVNAWRGETDTEEKMQKRVEYDLHYLSNWSLELDLQIIMMTILKGFFGRNAY